MRVMKFLSRPQLNPAGKGNPEPSSVHCGLGIRKEEPKQCPCGRSERGGSYLTEESHRSHKKTLEICDLWCHLVVNVLHVEYQRLKSD